MTDPDSSFESASVAAILARRGRDDQNELLAELVMLLADVVPGAQVKRALIRRHVQALRLPLGDYVYVLERNGDSFAAIRVQQVRGVAIRSVPMEIDAFLEELGLALDVELRRTERGRDALRQWLSSNS
jgi:hypothetical protein